MKNKTIKTITCLLAGLTLTSCGIGDSSGGKPTSAPFCAIRSNADNPRCADILSRATAITWLQSFASPLPNTASQARSSTSFLRVNEDGTINTSGVNVNFADGRARTLTRDGDIQDGVIFYKGTPNGSNAEHFFAGILPTTDLGPPVPRTEPEATWTGSYRRAGNAVVNDVNFNIDFNDRTINARVPLDGNNDINIDDFDTLRVRASIGGSNIGGGSGLAFNLGFNSRGVIDGTVSAIYVRTFDSASASGLIGQDGLVGVFVDSSTGQEGLQNFYGGFWAEPDNN